MIYQGRDEPKDQISRALFLVDSLLATYPIPIHNPQLLSSVLNEINMYGQDLDMAYYYRPDPRFAVWRDSNVVRSGRWVQDILDAQPIGYHDIRNLNHALAYAISYQGFNKEELTKLINTLSPFQGGLKSDWLKNNYRLDKLILSGSEFQNYGFKHNGLYQQLAYLYAATGNSERALQSMDTLLANSQNNFQGDYASGGDNAANIAAVYFRYGNVDALNVFVDGYCSREKITAVEFYERMIARTLHSLETSGTFRLFNFMNETLNLNIKYPGKKQLGLYFRKYRETIEVSIAAGDQKNFLLALSYKDEGILKSAIWI